MKIGLQLYSIRNEMKKDPLSAIKKVRDIGYRYIELENHQADKDSGTGFEIPAVSLKHFTDSIGVSVINAHLLPCKLEYIDKIIEYHTQIGNSKLTTAIEFFSSKSDVLWKCEEFNKIGKKCKDHGMAFLYHNHFHEFQKIDDKSVFDIIAENTDPEYVFFELDTYWVLRGGVSPVEVLKKLDKRTKLLHQKDLPDDPSVEINALQIKDLKNVIDMQEFQRVFSPKDVTEIGSGIMNIQEIIDTANQIGIEYLIIEQDFSRLSELESVKRSYEQLKEYNNITY